MKSDIMGIFPISVYRNVDYEHTKEEKKFIETYKNYGPNLDGNLVSVEKNILDHVTFKNLKQHIELCLEEYSKNVLCIENKVKIVLSWINKNNPKTSHHAHCHPNSFLSGVFYFQESQIKFNNANCQIKNTFIHVDPTSYNAYNSDILRYGVDTNTLIIFPSTLTHSVEPNLTKVPRYSLSFNTFLTGKIGINSSSTELILN